MTGTERRALRTLLMIGLGVIALGASGCATRVYARPASGVVVYSAPPPPRVVVTRPPPPYAGAVWVDGHYQWNGAQYVWVDGYWIEPRPGYVFVQPRWEHQGGRYVYVPGGWARGGRIVHHVSPPRPAVVARPGHVHVHPRPVHPRPVVVQQRPGAVRRPPPARVVHPRPAPSVRVSGPRGTVTVRPR